MGRCRREEKKTGRREEREVCVRGVSFTPPGNQFNCSSSTHRRGNQFLSHGGSQVAAHQKDGTHPVLPVGTKPTTGKKGRDRMKFTKLSFYYLKLEKAPWITTIRCKSNTGVLLSFLIPGMKQAECCKVTFLQPVPLKPTNRRTDKLSPLREGGRCGR